ncbi:protein S100-A14 isoform X1 [Numida meleagris]|uniref:protein S100-A14 isoform X1 n=1 Tax=Numida meleagris TaxID=8996 RepID=UPI000B3DFE5A|nr:protein S100-A14 isoform X1 [Numida meleagris]
MPGVRGACCPVSGVRCTVPGAWYPVPGAWHPVLGAWYPVPSAWYSVHGAWFLVHGTQCMVRGSWCSVHCTQCMVRGSWCSVHGTQCMVRGSWCMVPNAWHILPGAQCMVPGAQCMVLGARCVVPGAWCMVPNAWCVVPGAQCMVPGAQLWYPVQGARSPVPVPTRRCVAVPDGERSVWLRRRRFPAPRWPGARLPNEPPCTTPRWELPLTPPWYKTPQQRSARTAGTALAAGKWPGPSGGFPHAQGSSTPPLPRSALPRLAGTLPPPGRVPAARRIPGRLPRPDAEGGERSPAANADRGSLPPAAPHNPPEQRDCRPPRSSMGQCNCRKKRKDSQELTDVERAIETVINQFHCYAVKGQKEYLTPNEMRELVVQKLPHLGKCVGPLDEKIECMGDPDEAKLEFGEYWDMMGDAAKGCRRK